MKHLPITALWNTYLLLPCEKSTFTALWNIYLLLPCETSTYYCPVKHLPITALWSTYLLLPCETSTYYCPVKHWPITALWNINLLLPCETRTYYCSVKHLPITALWKIYLYCLVKHLPITALWNIYLLLPVKHLPITALWNFYLLLPCETSISVFGSLFEPTNEKRDLSIVRFAFLQTRCVAIQCGQISSSLSEVSSNVLILDFENKFSETIYIYFGERKNLFSTICGTKFVVMCAANFFKIG